jgi:hypothetical protein
MLSVGKAQHAGAVLKSSNQGALSVTIIGLQGFCADTFRKQNPIVSMSKNSRFFFMIFLFVPLLKFHDNLWAKVQKK